MICSDPYLFLLTKNPLLNQSKSNILHGPVFGGQVTLGKILLNALTAQHLQKYYSGKILDGRRDGKGGLSPRTVREHHVIIHGALQWAVKMGLLIRNVADAVDPPRYQQKEMRTFDEDGLTKFLDIARSTPYCEVFFTALYTGLRRSELLGLQWEDIDIVLAELRIVRTRHQLHDGSTVLKTPKTARSRRVIALTPSNVLMFREYLERQKSLWTLEGRTLRGSDFVFTDSEGQPLMPDTVTQAWIKLVRRAGCKGIRLHDARHSHASLMLKQGVHPKIVSERLGHASINITIDTYSHVLPGLQQAAALKFDEALQSSSERSNISELVPKGITK